MTSDEIKNEDGFKSRWSMHYGATPKLFELAETLRGNMTIAEKVLWNILKNNDWQLIFRRQHPIAIYIADFYCHKVKLVIELDGGYHENKEVKIYDETREKDIREFGITILRFKNEEIINDIEKVLTEINSMIAVIQTTGKWKTAPDSPHLGLAKVADCSRNSPLGAGGKTDYSKNFSLETGGKADYSQTSALETRGEVETSKNSPPAGGDGGKLFVIKIGGNIIDDDTALGEFLKNFASIDAKKILVHGGGKIATKIGEQLGIQSNYINGRRITDAATIDLVTMVYGGLVNKKIVAKLQAFECNAIGLTGADANIIPATKRAVTQSSISESDKDPGGIDYGFAGDIIPSSIGIHSLEILLLNNFTPVFAPLTHDCNGQMLNTNADTIASALAVGLSKNYKVRLIYCFEKKGIMEDVHNENSLIPSITKEKYRQLIHDKKLSEGILPKIDNAFVAIDNGVKEVLIGDANDLLQNVTDNTRGTLIK